MTPQTGPSLSDCSECGGGPEGAGGQGRGHGGGVAALYATKLLALSQRPLATRGTMTRRAAPVSRSRDAMMASPCSNGVSPGRESCVNSDRPGIAYAPTSKSPGPAHSWRSPGFSRFPTALYTRARWEDVITLENRPDTRVFVVADCNILVVAGCNILVVAKVNILLIFSERHV